MTDKTDIELMQQALHAMLDTMQVSGCISDKSFEAVKALRERLAKPEPRNQCGEACERAKLCAVCLAEMTKQPEQRPLINPPACTWTHDNDEGSWDAECGERWSITEGTPEENNFRFCPGCGRTVKTIFVTPRK
ncbi:MAG: hypothetical protein ING36_11325 [Burkholderiales bacterium]|jgi:hypothetical protein|nr:hypothetical protein [Burkholderiales bacterium]